MININSKTITNSPYLQFNIVKLLKNLQLFYYIQLSLFIKSVENDNS